jgi:SAM-dependent methyltransferase
VLLVGGGDTNRRKFEMPIYLQKLRYFFCSVSEKYFLIMRSDDIYIDGTYFKNNPHWGEEDAAWKAQVIFKLLAKNNIAPKEITEVGCGSGGILKNLSLLLNQQIQYKGYDISPQAINIAKEKENENIHFFNEDFLRIQNNKTDVLLIIDVVEHVGDYYGFLEKLKQKSNYFVFHIPLDLSWQTVLKPHILLQQRETVGHIHYFTKEMVEWFLKDSGYEIIDWVYTKPVIDELKPEKGFKRTLKRILRNAFYRVNKNLVAKMWGSYSMMILAK